MASVGNRLHNSLARIGPTPLLVRCFAFGIVVVGLLAVVNSVLDTDWSMVNVGHEGNIPTWFSSVQLLAVAVVLAPIAVRDAAGRKPRTWALLFAPGLFLLLSLDEVAMIHEQVGHRFEAETGIDAGLRYTGAWMLVFAPLVGAWSVVAALKFWPYLRNCQEALGLMVAGFLLFLLAAVGLEVLSNFLAEDGNLHRLEIFAEEMAEMVAVNLILWGALLLARAEGIRLVVGERSR